MSFLYNRVMKSKYIIFVVIVILFVIGLGVFMNKAAGPGKYDDFAKALRDRGAQFYGAFWCPHCQAQKAVFGSSKKYLPYIECSNPNKSQTQACTEAKIESYPTWRFKDGITLSSKDAPTVCNVKPGLPTEPAICAQISSEFYKTWLFPGYKFSVKSTTDPIVKEDVWKFGSGTGIAGEVPLDFLAQQIGFILPQ
jgi:thiol-disulfide isomerase/thioredoxin